MEVKIISLNKAIELGLSKSEICNKSGEGGLQPRYAYGATGKIGSDVALEVRRIDLKTGESIIIFEDEEYRKLKQKLKINEYAVDNDENTTSNPL